MADPRTIQVPIGTPAQTAEYALPPGVLQYIQSVVATVDTSGSGDVTPVLTIAEQSGVVVSDKQQVNAIVGGGSGRATWALGLADEQNLTGFLHWGTNTDSAHQGLVLSGFNFFNFATHGGFWANTTGGGFYHIDTAGGEYQLTADGGDVRIETTGNTADMFMANGISLVQVTSLTNRLQSDSVIVELVKQDLSDGTEFVIGIASDGSLNLFRVDSDGQATHQFRVAGKSCTWFDHNGNAIFRIDENGDLHGKTGKTLTFDL